MLLLLETVLPNEPNPPFQRFFNILYPSSLVRCLNLPPFCPSQPYNNLLSPLISEKYACLILLGEFCFKNQITAAKL